MFKRLAVAAALLACAFTLGAAEEVLYQVDLLPSGKMIARGEPTLKGANYLLKQYPTGTLVSLKKSTVKKITRMTPEQAAAANPMNQVTRIRDVAMQGPKQGNVGGRGGRTSNIDRARSAVGAANAGTAGRTTSPY